MQVQSLGWEFLYAVSIDKKRKKKKKLKQELRESQFKSRDQAGYYYGQSNQSSENSCRMCIGIFVSGDSKGNIYLLAPVSSLSRISLL